MKHPARIAILCSTLLLLAAGSNAAPTIEQPSKDEIREAREITAKFSARLRETRDLQPLISEFFVADFAKTGPGKVLRGPSAPPESAQLSDAQLLRWFTLHFNLDHAPVIYLAGKVPLQTVWESTLSRDQTLYPKELAAYLQSLNTKQRANSADQVSLGLAAREGALKIWQDHLAKDPPEQTRLFSENLAQFIGANNNGGDPWRKIEVEVSDAQKGVFPPGTRLIRIEILFNVGLTLVREKGDLKIASASVLPPECGC